MKFEVTIEQANLILHALSQLPYATSAGLIAELQQQAQPQLAEKQEEDAPVMN